MVGISTPEYTRPLEGQVAIITGGSRGIGRACAQLFADCGAKVLTVSRSELALPFDSNYQKVIKHLQADISEESEVDRVFDYCQEHLGPVSLLVNNAAIISHVAFNEIDMLEWDDVIKINVRGAVLCSKRAFDSMIGNGQGGTIINISSLAGIPNTAKFEGYSPYTVSKFALCGLTEALALEGFQHRIRVNAIAPGAVDTAMLKQASSILKTTTQPEDIAKIVLFLADAQQSRIITGSIIPVFCNGH